MFSIFRKGPKFVDREFADRSFMLTQDNDNPTYKRELLDASQLNFSMASLRQLDAYLEVLHANPPEGHDFMRVALRCGAYVGEVIRRELPGTWRWVGHDEAAKHSKTVAGFERSIATAGILWKNSEAMSFQWVKSANSYKKKKGAWSCILTFFLDIKTQTWPLSFVWRPNIRMYLTGYSGLCPLPPAGDAGCYA